MAEKEPRKLRWGYLDLYWMLIWKSARDESLTIEEDEDDVVSFKVGEIEIIPSYIIPRILIDGIIVYRGEWIEEGSWVSAIEEYLEGIAAEKEAEEAAIETERHKKLRQLDEKYRGGIVL